MNWNDFTLDEHATYLTREELDEIFARYDLDVDSYEPVAALDSVSK
jgi:hypothetical protein